MQLKGWCFVASLSNLVIIVSPMNRAMTKILTHTRMIIIRSMVKHAVIVLLAIYPAFRGSCI
jgi:hypothetical protein